MFVFGIAGCGGNGGQTTTSLEIKSQTTGLCKQKINDAFASAGAPQYKVCLREGNTECHHYGSKDGSIGWTVNPIAVDECETILRELLRTHNTSDGFDIDNAGCTALGKEADNIGEIDECPCKNIWGICV